MGQTDSIAKQIFRIFDVALKVFIVACGAGLFLSTVIQVFFRYVLNRPLSWTSEAATYFMIFAIFLSSYYAYVEGSHVRVSFLVERLPWKAQAVVSLLMNSLVLLFLIVVIITGLSLSEQFIGMKTPMLRIPRLVPFLAIPIGCGLMSVVAIKNIFQDIKNMRKAQHE